MTALLACCDCLGTLYDGEWDEENEVQNLTLWAMSHRRPREPVPRLMLLAGHGPQIFTFVPA